MALSGVWLVTFVRYNIHIREPPQYNHIQQQGNPHVLNLDCSNLAYKQLCVAVVDQNDILNPIDVVSQCKQVCSQLAN